MRFHLDLDGHGALLRADAASASPDDGDTSDPTRPRVSVPRPGRVLALPVLQQAVDHPAAVSPPGWFTVDAPAADTLVVPAGARVLGNCRAGSVHVHGEVLGHVQATRGLLLVAPEGRVCGGVEGAGPVVIAGRVRASRGADAVVAHGRLDLACSARVTGDVCHEVVAIYEGARVEGVLRGLDRRRRGA